MMWLPVGAIDPTPFFLPIFLTAPRFHRYAADFAYSLGGTLPSAL